MARSRWASVKAVKTSLLSLILKLLHKLSGNVLRRIGITTDIPLGPMAQSPFQFICVGMGDVSKLKSEGVTQIMRTQGSNLARGIADLCIMPFADLCQEQVNRLRRESPI